MRHAGEFWGAVMHVKVLLYPRVTEMRGKRGR